MDLRIAKYVIFVSVALLLLSQGLPAATKTWRLEQGKEWKQVSPEGQDKFLVAVARMKQLVSEGQTDEVRRAAAKLKKDFTEIAGQDFDSFMKGEILYSEGKLTKEGFAWASQLGLLSGSTSIIMQPAKRRRLIFASARVMPMPSSRPAACLS